MNRVEIINRSVVSQADNDMDDFASVAQEVLRSSKVQNEVTTHFKEEDTLSDEEIVDMILTQSIMDETARQMKQSQERLKEILNED
ncbi:hypothetical protein CCZ37_07310 [Vibrio qinghaiensis]|jgi:hypothetical protein|uniref:Uncharacterized protein n=1 Tax=Vibrio qinghaiensis TaxID=2025808 RepID=A0A223MXV8_9VIBR|nr:hypothetical protein [Vibrio qinghaiensis]ASU22409.1 hypothetical protein CCZ37_07310 [Vibrio qinghaiensis]